jgi:uncharacterized membrane protein
MARNDPSNLSGPAPHTGFVARIRNYFLTGLVVTGPLAVTLYLTWSFINWVDGFIRPFIPPVYRPETYLPWPIPGTGLVVAFVVLTLLGFLTANLVGRSLVELGESLLNRMPIVRPVYKTMKQVFEETSPSDCPRSTTTTSAPFCRARPTRPPASSSISSARN